jgi:hypothetical protein
LFCVVASVFATEREYILVASGLPTGRRKLQLQLDSQLGERNALVASGLATERGKSLDASVG